MTTLVWMFLTTFLPIGASSCRTSVHEHDRIDVPGVDRPFGDFTGTDESRGADGRLRSRVEYLNGWRNGVDEGYHENGQLSFRSQYRMGRLVGVDEQWAEDGQLLYRREHDEAGNLLAIDSWYSSGKERFHGRYEQGVRVGVWEWWNEDGSLVSRRAYAMGDQVR